MADTIDGVILDLDETLVTTSAKGVSTRREEGLRGILRKLTNAGKKLFIVSGTDPVPDGQEIEQWRESKKREKLAQLEQAGLPLHLFEELFVVLPTQGITIEQFMASPALTSAEYSRAKRQAMESVLSRNGLDGSRVLSIGDRLDIEGTASKELEIEFIEMLPACSILPTDTLEWILKTRVLGEREELPGPLIEHDEKWLRRLAETNPSELALYEQFNHHFKEYVMSRAWEILAVQGIRCPKVEAPDFNRFNGCLTKAWEAASELGRRYDLIIGIARKGLWLSFVFNLYGLENVREVYLARENGGRKYCPISPIYKRDVEGKRILLLDNDALTGRSVKAIADHLKGVGARQVDALFIHDVCEPEDVQPSDLKDRLFLRPFLDVPRLLGQREDGKLVIDFRSQLRQVEAVDRVMTLRKNFSRIRKPKEVMPKIGRRLGVVTR